ncbi:MAG: hypothetical protein K2L90_00780 [Muribaculaceae bacterium]|nr:hypothetical protein [Muribaculaceae bacterium]
MPNNPVANVLAMVTGRSNPTREKMSSSWRYMRVSAGVNGHSSSRRQKRVIMSV